MGTTATTSSPTEQRILVMRHPETVANVEHFLSGRKDVGVTERGESQRRRAVDALVSWAPDLILTSPLSRCRAIAQPVAQALGVECRVDERLVEIEFGTVEGVTMSDMHEMGYVFPWPFSTDGISQPAPGAEGFEDLVARAKGLVDDLASMPGRTACITHGGFTRALMAAVYNADVREFWHLSVANVSSQVFSVRSGKLYLEAFGLTPEEVVARMTDTNRPHTVNAKGVYR
jgi:broad specificity phosphatase PhoE